ncbi:MAG: hypothetical protein U1G07_03280 [Verrucomicrobiota bacterium]
MSFTRLLAAGRSIMGIKQSPSPYKMSQEHLLPKFNRRAKEPAPELALAAPGAPVGTDQVAETLSPPAKRGGSPSGSRREARPPRTSRSRLGGILGSFGSGWRRLIKRGRGQAAQASPVGRPVQTELSLDTVKVVCNDLADAEDAEGPGRRRRWRDLDHEGQRFGMVWNRLSARLLRQAVQEFNVVQKERGKLLSQTDHGGGGARGA